jgi:predicted alpha/beta superfamily hydrolase
MSSENDQDDLAARKARNDAIRRARDRHNAGADPAADEDAAAKPDDSATGPNYVEFIDRKMKEKQKPKE